jgi:hypothetical protein
MHNDKHTNDKGQARGWAVGMAIAAGLLRLIQYPFNFTPVAGLGLFGGARLRSWWALAVPLVVMAVTDVLLWALRGHRDYTLLAFAFNPWVYLSFLLAVLWGRCLRENDSLPRLALISVIVSVQFFLITNLGAWYTFSVDPETMPSGTAVVFETNPNLPAPIPLRYSYNLSGLLACYAAALPFAGSNSPPLGFFGNQLVGDLFYAGLIFGAYALLRRGVLLPRRVREPVAARTT